MAPVPQILSQECFRWPLITAETIAKIADLLRSVRIRRNPEVIEGFESDFSRFFRVKHALPVCNGTAAAFSAYRALGLGRGDEIIAPAFTHQATAISRLWRQPAPWNSPLNLHSTARSRWIPRSWAPPDTRTCRIPSP
jgi:dTDP-4-amino-4,6-dideoxygalactose transaminase